MVVKVGHCIAPRTSDGQMEKSPPPRRGGTETAQPCHHERPIGREGSAVPAAEKQMPRLLRSLVMTRPKNPPCLRVSVVGFRVRHKPVHPGRCNASPWLIYDC